NADLTELNNALVDQAGGKRIQTIWKGKKSDLVESILEMQAAIDARNAEAAATMDDEDDEDLDRGAPVEEADDDLGQEPSGSELDAEAETVVSPDEPAAKQTIRATALDLLCTVAYYEDKTRKSDDDNRVEAGHKNARSVGYDYHEIIRR